MGFGHGRLNVGWRPAPEAYAAFAFRGRNLPSSGWSIRLRASR